MIAEWCNTETTNRVDKTFFPVTLTQIHLDNPFDYFRHLVSGKRRTENFSDAGVISLRAANRNLIPLAAILVDAENADVTNVVVAACINAAR